VITADDPTILDFTFFGEFGTDLFEVFLLVEAGALKSCSDGSDSIPFLTPITLRGIVDPESNLSKSILHETVEPDIFPKSFLLSIIPSFGATR
jgi:hypothetical protein